ncbi:AlbA family DNA-binding domain-containing protein [Microbacterium maritypicum]
MSSPVVVDGRLTREKLLELLALGAEYPELDFKATLDLRDRHHCLGLVKDIIAMANNGTGGYVVIGAEENGTPATGRPPCDPRQFDSADLAQQVSRHVITAPVVTSQSHEVNGHPMVLIHVAPSASGLPAIISGSGEYADGKRMRVVLEEGVLYVREGTRNVAATDAHWPQMLNRYRASVVAETRESIDALIAQVVNGLGEQTGGARLVPLAAEMDDSTFAEAVAPYFDSAEGQNKLRRFLRSLRPLAGVGADSESQRVALDKLTIVAVQAVFAASHESFDTTIDIIHELYLESVGSFNGDYADRTRAQYWLDILLRLLAIGATAVQEHAWWAIEPLVNKGVTDYYPNWLRHALVHASRADLLSGSHREAAMVLVRTRALVIANPNLAPGLEGSEVVSDDQELPLQDALLNALCRFDFLWCVVAAATHTDRSDGSLFYPSCAALRQDRTNPVIELLAKSENVRRAVLPDTTDDVWKDALKRVFNVAQTQSRQYGAWWHAHGFDDFVERFVTGESQLGKLLGE